MKKFTGANISVTMTTVRSSFGEVGSQELGCPSLPPAKLVSKPSEELIF